MQRCECRAAKNSLATYKKSIVKILMAPERHSVLHRPSGSPSGPAIPLFPGIANHCPESIASTLLDERLPQRRATRLLAGVKAL